MASKKQSSPKPHSKRRLLQVAAEGTSGPYPPRIGISTFSEHHVSKARWEGAWRGWSNWTLKGASLLRAARVIAQELVDDAKVQRPNIQGPAALHEQVVMLAALAVENALKAVIVSRMDRSIETGKFPDEIDGHSLLHLAATAQILPNDETERDALDHGTDYIEWIGRYASSKWAEATAAGRSLDPLGMFHTYERIFHRCVEACLQRESTVHQRLEQAAADAYLARWRAFYMLSTQSGSRIRP